MENFDLLNITKMLALLFSLSYRKLLIMLFWSSPDWKQQPTRPLQQALLYLSLVMRLLCFLSLTAVSTVFELLKVVAKSSATTLKNSESNCVRLHGSVLLATTSRACLPCTSFICRHFYQPRPPQNVQCHATSLKHPPKSCAWWQLWLRWDNPHYFLLWTVNGVIQSFQ